MHEENHKQAELAKIKIMAGALFWLAIAIYILASIFEEQYIWVGFVSATAEAAMVGAIADWFAVTALFRHPLGLKIPHTAIIPRRKDAIAENFGRFVQRNFLSEEVIFGKLRSMNVTKSATEWISQPENSKLIANHAAVGIAAVVQIMKDEDIQEMIERSLQNRIQSTQIAPLLGNLLSLVTSGSRKQELLRGTVKLGVHLLEENGDVIQEKIAQETPWWFPEPVDKAIYKKIVTATRKTLRDVDTDPNHPLRKRFDAVIDGFLDDLKHSPEVADREEAIKAELIQHPVVQDFSSSLWVDIKTSVLDHSSDPNTEFRKAIEHGVNQFGKALLEDEVLLEKINRWVEESTLYLIREYGYEVERLISQTIRKWDAESASKKIELQIGKDLQFIRINGTIVGGLAGLVIHTLTFFL